MAAAERRGTATFYKTSPLIGDDAAAITIGSEVFSRIKAEGSNFPQGSGAMSSDRGTVGLRRIFDDAEPVAASDRANGFHIATLSIAVDRYDGARSRRDRRFDARRIDKSPVR
jgi:hypothetical protein